MVLACVSLPSVALSSCACLSLWCVLGHPPFLRLWDTLSGNREHKNPGKNAAILGADSTQVLMQHFKVQIAHKSLKMQHFKVHPLVFHAASHCPQDKICRVTKWSLEIYRIISVARVHIQIPWTADLYIRKFSGNKNM